MNKGNCSVYQGLPSRIVKIVYKPDSFNEAELAKGPGNLIHYLYFYGNNPLDDERLKRAYRKGAEVYIFECTHTLKVDS